LGDNEDSQSQGLWLGLDTGGTFTDAVLLGDGKRVIASAKALTTPWNLAIGIGKAIRAVLRLLPAGASREDVSLVSMSTTLATNAIIERKGARTALLATRGFRDSIEMAYEHRFEQYDIFMDKPAPLVPRNLRLSVPERIDATGRIIEPLDEQALADLVPVLRAEGVI